MRSKRPALDELALQQETDKGSRHHGYTRLYERYLESWRDREFTLLEIGVCYGGSLKTWREYFPQARIIGIDRDPNCAAYLQGVDVSFEVADQGDPAALARVAARHGPFDLVIDDGSHRVADQVVSLHALWPHLRAGGLYVLEDLHVAYWESHGLPHVGKLIDAVMLSGKSGWGELGNDPEGRRIWDGLDLFERTLESVHIYKNLAFLWKAERWEVYGREDADHRPGRAVHA